MTRWSVILGDVRTALASIPDGSVNACVTSPPYWGLRDYGHAGQIGLETTPDAYVAEMVAVFRDVRRTLRDDGTCWVNLGDSYAASGAASIGNAPSTKSTLTTNGGRGPKPGDKYSASNAGRVIHREHGLKAKDLVGIPWRVAFALQADGWYLRSDIIWHKPNPMPESVTDRPTKAHEYVFLLTKRDRYAYDADAVAEVATNRDPHNKRTHKYGDAFTAGDVKHRTKANLAKIRAVETRNARTVWTLASEPCAEAHFAVFPEELPRRCILAGCPKGGLVLDPFTGSGTTGMVALKLGRRFVGCELNPEYHALASERIGAIAEDSTVQAKRQGQVSLFGKVGT
jgi:DNA modification methylase